MKGLVLGNKIVPADAIDSLEVSVSPLTRQYQVLAKQGLGMITLFVSPDKASAEGVYNALSAALYEPVSVADNVVTALEKRFVQAITTETTGKWVLSKDQKTLSKNKTIIVTKVDGSTLTLADGDSVKVEENSSGGFNLKFGAGTATAVRITAEDLEKGYVEAKVESNTYNYKLMLNLPIPQDVPEVDTGEDADLTPGRTPIPFVESTYAKALYDEINRDDYIQSGYTIKTPNDTVVVARLNGLPIDIKDASKIKYVVSNAGKLKVAFGDEDFVEATITNDKVGKHIQIDTASVRFIVKVTAIYIPQYTVKIYDGKSLSLTKKVDKTDKWTLPSSELSKEGYDLEGFYTNEDLDGSHKINSTTIPVHKDMNLYIKWKIKTFTVTFNVDGGTSIPNQKVNWGGKASKPSQDPTKADNTFAGYFKDQQKKTVFDFDSELIKSNTTIYIKWTPNTPAADTPQNDVETVEVNVPPVKKTRTRKTKTNVE